ncbi:MAG TPA: NAD(P)H-quinone oxidoreductase [Stellaceae bacterium]|nr:NAD(P)H-quinone oxidoreductase [Stellaceae bacterium]
MSIPNVKTMKAVVVEKPGGPDALKLVERPMPVPDRHEVLVKVAAAGLNGADLGQRLGRYRMPPGAPDIFGLEAAGEVVAVGPGVTRWREGDKVAALLVGGGYAEYVAVPDVQCLPAPANLSLLEAAALPECAMTVWSNVFELGRLQPGDRILVHGGASGIGTTAIQLARAIGAIPYATAGSKEKCARCESLGAKRAIDYRSEDFAAVIRDETHGEGVDVVLDMVGGDYLNRDLRILRHGGRLVMIAFKQGSTVPIDCTLVQDREAIITGSRLRPRPIAEKGRLAAAVEKAVWPMIADGRVKPVIDSTHALADAARAHERLESGAHIGKVMLTI